ncbi:hypothetical protein FXF51_56780 [Nonomuraea sp. PA05]|uniref:hypothetical protein n=1 Tax=Nonomuraea sp. PA05 TaxID=2604466 RepID=UPI0011D7AA00|nr:hypothetical protein [Nonomuraea sp. PA05]TYB50238.1 hypothetical protein FXF51_56780 [Nonomuraea sp. PA05]
MGSLPPFLLRHTVIVEPFEGNGPIGPEYGEQTVVRCFVEEKRRLVRDAAGVEVVSETTIYAPLDTVCPAESRVTVNGRATVVIVSARRDGGGLPTPDHLEVACK